MQPIKSSEVTEKIYKLEPNILSCKDIDPKNLYKHSEQIYSKHLLIAHQGGVSKHGAIIPSLQKLIPTRKECEEPRIKPKNK